jgi:hypothetical protein
VCQNREAGLFVWHYTPIIKLPEIAASGALLPLRQYNAGAKPLIWFSANQSHEPASAKMVATNQAARYAPTMQQRLNRLGWVRFGILDSDPRLIRWHNAWEYAGIEQATPKHREKLAKDLGSDTSAWMVTAVSIPLSDFNFSCRKNGISQPCSIADALKGIRVELRNLATMSIAKSLV